MTAENTGIKSLTRFDSKKAKAASDSKVKAQGENNVSCADKFIKPLIACIAYLVVGPTLIMLNRYILKDLKFSYPMSLSGLGLVSSSAISFLLVKVFRIVRLKHSKSVTLKFYMLRIMPIGLFTALTLNFGNRVYLHLSVSLIQMLKAFTPVVTMIMLAVSGLSKPTKLLVGSVFLICVGTAISSAGAIQYTVTGFAFMFLSQFFESFRLVLIQLLVGGSGMKFSVIEGLFYIAPATVMWMVFGLLPFFEFPDMIEANAFQIMKDNAWTFLLASLLGFGVNFVGYFVIQTTSALTLNVFGTIRNLGLIVVSMRSLHEVVTAEQAGGFFVTLSGFTLFQWLKLTGRAERKEDETSRKGYTKVSVEDDDTDLDDAGVEMRSSIPTTPESPILGRIKKQHRQLRHWGSDLDAHSPPSDFNDGSSAR